MAYSQTLTVIIKGDIDKVTTIKKILKWVNTYIATVAAIGVGLFFFFHQLERPNLKTPDKILHLEGQVIDYSFQLKRGYRATLKQYYIWLDNYDCTFQIKADFLSYFYQSRFENEVIKGDRIRIAIPKEYENQLWDRSKNVFILSVSKNSTDYLSCEETIPRENNKFDIYAGLLFLTAGVVYYLLKRNTIIR